MHVCVLIQYHWSYNIKLLEKDKGMSFVIHSSRTSPEFRKEISTMVTTSPEHKCFVDRGELKAATDRYIYYENCAENSACAVGREYGWPMNSWCVGEITDMGELFWGEWGFDEDISSWDVSKVTDMSRMFRYAYAFNHDIDSWNTSCVRDMDSMFWSASAFNQPIHSWDTSAVTTMKDMFYGASKFNQGIDSWNVSSVKDMSEMFRYAYAFNQDIDSWDMSSVHNMVYMFGDASSFNHELDSWDLSSVTDMVFMFDGASSFSQSLCSWGRKDFPYDAAGDVFTNSGCRFRQNPQKDQGGPFCNATCVSENTMFPLSRSLIDHSFPNNVLFCAKISNSSTKNSIRSRPTANRADELKWIWAVMVILSISAHLNRVHRRWRGQSRSQPSKSFLSRNGRKSASSIAL